MAEAAHHPYSITVAYWLAAMPSLLQGDFPKAIFWLERCQDLCRRENTPLCSGSSPGSSVKPMLAPSASRKVCPCSSRRPNSSGARRHALVPWHGQRARHRLPVGRAAGGRAPSVRRALQLSQAHKQPGVEAEALRVLGDIQAGHTPADVEAADAAYRQALALAEPRGMRPLVAHCHLGLGKLHRRAGDAAKAQEHLTTARNMYREMGMTFWLEKAEAVDTGGEP